jgi:hypothetical protein
MTEMDQLVTEKIEWYKLNKQGKKGRMMTPMMLNEVESQYIEMAQGGDGSIAQMGNIRKEYYGTMPDEFFQRVCDGMGWQWRVRN